MSGDVCEGCGSSGVHDNKLCYFTQNALYTFNSFTMLYVHDHNINSTSTVRACVTPLL